MHTHKQFLLKRLVQLPIKAKHFDHPVALVTFWALPTKFEGEMEPYNPFNSVKIIQRSIKTPKPASLHGSMAGQHLKDFIQTNQAPLCDFG